MVRLELEAVISSPTSEIVSSQRVGLVGTALVRLLGNLFCIGNRFRVKA